eukprot:1912473-Prymnesium_polylepis.1
MIAGAAAGGIVLMGGAGVLLRRKRLWCHSAAELEAQACKPGAEPDEVPAVPTTADAIEVRAV